MRGLPWVSIGIDDLEATPRLSANRGGIVGSSASP